MGMSRRCLLACSLAVLLAGCGRTGPWRNGDLLALRIEPDALQMYLQQTVQLEIRGLFLTWDQQQGWGQVVQDVTGADGLSLWSSDSAVVKVLDGTRLFGMAAGTTRVNAWWQGRLVSIPVEVHYALLAGIEARPDDLQLSVGDYRKLQVVGRLTDGSEIDLTSPALGTSYSIDNHAAAMVTTEGIVFGLADGLARVRVEHGDLDVEVPVVVGSGRHREAITVAPQRLDLKPGDSARVRVVGLWSDGSSDDLTGDAETSLVSDTPQVARVATDGLVTALAEGQATVQARYRDFSATCLVTVDEGAVNPQPRLDGITPAQVAAGAGPVTILASGAGFIQQSRLFLDGRQLAATLLDSGRLQAGVGAGYTASAGSHQVWVENPAPGGGSSARLEWLVVSAPRVDSLLPNQALAGSNVRLLFHGSGLGGCHPESSTPAVSFGQVIVAAGGERLWVTASVDPQAAAGSYRLQLVNAAGRAEVEFSIVKPDTVADLVIKGPSTTTLSGVQYYRNIVIGTGARVLGVGDDPLQLLATGNVEINGTIDVRGHNGQVGYLQPAAGGDAGPGGAGGGAGADGDGPQPAAGGAGSPPGQAAEQPAGAGTGSGSGGGDGAGEGIAGGCAQAGGGGGLAGAGGSGGGDAGAGSGGRGGGPGNGSYFGGGSGGGGGSTCSEGSGGGGGGGGAVIVIASLGGGDITVRGSINADGGDGGIAYAGGGGGGGGSGGRIVLTSGGGHIIVEDTLSVRGGDGGSAWQAHCGGGGGGGIILVDAGGGGVEDSLGFYDARGGSGGTPLDPQAAQPGFPGLDGQPGSIVVRH